MLENIHVTSKFWQERQRVIRDEMIPYQWEVINDLKKVDIAVTNTGGDNSVLDKDKSYVVDNFLIAAGKKQGKRGGMVFQDSDAYKWLEAAAYSLECFPDEELKAKCDRLVQIIADAQEEDGYLNTYFTVNEPDRKYQSLYMSHELYCAGHFIEAAVAYYKVTKSELVLRVAERLADNIFLNFGPEEGKIHGGDGHEEIELALLRLYELTREKRYLSLAEYFLKVRGQDKDFFIRMMQRDVSLGRKSLIQGLEIMHPDFDSAYFQSDKPVEEQVEAKGHAVRVVYLCSALALSAALTSDERLMRAANNYWHNIVERRMYITGAIGSTNHGEAFTADYDLPKDTIYGETCASVGLTFFANNMMRCSKRGIYGDVMEQALYNTVLAGMNLDGKGYFYVNPLEVNPEYSRKNPTLYHALPRRVEWFACACCPPNLARMVMSIGHYAYQSEEQSNTIFANLYMSCDAKFKLAGEEIELKQATNYPWDADIRFTVAKCGESGFNLALRIPQWCSKFICLVNDEKVESTVRNGFLHLPKALYKDDIVILDLKMGIDVMEANPLINADYGKVAVMRGPMVYCAEQCDNGAHLQYLHLGAKDELTGEFDPNLLGGIYKIRSNGLRRINDFVEGSYLYRRAQQELYDPALIELIPYYAWCNRSEGEMRVWLNTAVDKE